MLLARLLSCLAVLRRADCCCCCCLWCRCQLGRCTATAAASMAPRACSTPPRPTASRTTTTRGAGTLCSIVRNIISDGVSAARGTADRREASGRDEGGRRRAAQEGRRAMEEGRTTVESVKRTTSHCQRASSETAGGRHSDGPSRLGYVAVSETWWCHHRCRSCWPLLSQRSSW